MAFGLALSSRSVSSPIDRVLLLAFAFAFGFSFAFAFAFAFGTGSEEPPGIQRPAAGLSGGSPGLNVRRSGERFVNRPL